LFLGKVRKEGEEERSAKIKTPSGNPRARLIPANAEGTYFFFLAGFLAAGFLAAFLVAFFID
jgi:hypothetical protein